MNPGNQHRRTLLFLDLLKWPRRKWKGVRSWEPAFQHRLDSFRPLSFVSSQSVLVRDRLAVPSSVVGYQDPSLFIMTAPW
eukprot:scaffold17_cov187-Ochromonas_danica.AAC.14